MPYQPALLGTARLNNFRLNYLPAGVAPIRETRILIFLDGVLVRDRVRRGSVTIHDVLNDVPNTCQFAIDGTPAPEPGMQVRITINTNTPRLLFNGTLETAALTYEGKPAHTVYACSATDDTMRADNRRPFAYYPNVSASTVVADLVARFAPGLTATYVQADLPAVTVAFDGTEGFNGCLRAIAKIVGAYFYWEDGALHFFLDEPTQAPDPLTPTTPTLSLEPPIASTVDDSQIRTRVYGRGWGTTLLADVAAGETLLPVANTALLTGAGTVIVSRTADGSPTDRVTYTSVITGGPGTTGTIVGPGVTPVAAPTLAYMAGSGLAVGVYRYAYTFVTASGESLPGPLASITTRTPIANPTAALTYWYSHPGPGGPLKGGFRASAYTFVTADGETAISPLNGPWGPYAAGGEYAYPSLPIGPAGTIARRFYRTPGMATSGEANATALKLCQTINDNTTVDIADTVPDSSLTTPPPPVNQTGGLAVQLSNVAIGPSAVTARKIYRTPVNGSALKLQQTIANNTATTGADTLPDGSLGAAAPTSDTSSLSQPSGAVLPGSTSIITTGGALPAAGWMLTTGGAVIRYTGISGNTLTGVPATGSGAIVTAISYGAALVPAPALGGVTGNTMPLPRGARVHIFVQRDDVAAQAAAAERESTAIYAADGIHEHLIVDERRAETSLVARCDADLKLFAYPLTTVAYASRDVKTKSGKPIEVNLPALPIVATLVIQDVTISELDIADGLAPRFTTTASSVKFSLEDLLRRMAALLPE